MRVTSRQLSPVAPGRRQALRPGVPVGRGSLPRRQHRSGLLCNGCNSALGHFRDSLEALRRALEYLQSGPSSVPPREVT
ncbi:endonuclease domain-containing protein [Micromonospora sp. NPDC050795]|uniref:endonuclease domain-containing protein n=1 Tax=Micromonospora sp. NPDC050795 TaxID=3364282 RepID=UPI003788F875